MSQRVIDAHHHLYVRPNISYLLGEYLADAATGHDVRASVYVQARASYDPSASVEFQPLGETRFARAASEAAQGGQTQVAAGIVGFADLTLGERVRPVLERHIAEGGGNFRGIRHILAWDPDKRLLNPAYPTIEELTESPAFRLGLAQLAGLGLSFDVWALFPQLPRIAKLAAAFPNTRFVVDHCGGIVRINDYAGRPAIFETWKQGITALAALDNVWIKLSGLGMRQCGFNFDNAQGPPGPDDLADAWRPWVLTCLEKFGAKRCMWGSNFPVDKESYSFASGLAAFKQVLSGSSAEERDDVFWGTAQLFYRLG